MHFFVEFVRSRVPSNWRLNSTGWLSGNCPVCVQNGQSRPDRKRRGGFHFQEDEWVYNCFNCKFSTGWSKGHRLNNKIKSLLKGFGCTEADLQRVSLELMREAETAEFLNPISLIKPPFKPEWPEIVLPDQAQPISSIEQVTDHFAAALHTIDQRDLAHWTDWAYSNSIKFRRRIILPYRYRGACVGFTARYIGHLPEGTPKYLVQKPKGFVFNLDRQTEDRTAVIVTEGDFDAITVDGVALGSNSLSNEQASLINQLQRRVVLLPDADKSGVELIEPAIAEGWAVSFPPWMDECKDANEAAIKYGRTFVVYSVLQHAIDNPTKIRVLAKRYLK